MTQIENRIAQELNVRVEQINAVVALLAEGATVPFIARYRKEKTGGLDDTQLRKLEERLGYLRQLEDRRTAILKRIDEQGKLTPDLKRTIMQIDNKVELEDAYAPYKIKRRTKAQIACEAGLEPLANALLQNGTLDPVAEAQKFLNADADVTTPGEALDGAQSILIERFSENARLVGSLRDWQWSEGRLATKIKKGKDAEGEKFADYFDFRQPVKDVPPHRASALLRGKNEGLLRVGIDVDAEPDRAHPAENKIRSAFNIGANGRETSEWLSDTVRQAWRTKLHKSLTSDLLNRLKEHADTAAIDVFKTNLTDLLLAAPAGPRPTLGLDPGIRTGVKVAVVDGTGKLLDTSTVYPHEPRRDWDGALATLARLCIAHKVEVIAIGNGTASRETDKLAGELIKTLASQGTAQKPVKIMVSEAGASVYSASELAAKEFPDLDVSLRGAVSIARRLQDPLAELVKIEPKAIGVGQYQHDVDQTALARSLDAAVEDCVNAVGVDVNTASAPLLARVAGLNATIAQNIVQYRDANGAFKKRSQIKKVPRLGPKAFEQAAGFLRIMDGSNPLDASAVHPEAYSVVERIAAKTSMPVKSMIGDVQFLRTLRPEQFADDTFGIPTVTDIIAELEKPGRDPRPEFKTATFDDGVEKITDLKVGMRLEGVVTNVTAFGAFVDVGVHQDGLVHISEMADKFVKDPREIVRTGEIVRTVVLDVDVDRKRIALSMKSQAGSRSEHPASGAAGGRAAHRAPAHRSNGDRSDPPQGETALAAALKGRFNNLPSSKPT